MKTRKLSALLVMALALTVLMTGCPKPTAEMKRAEEAIKEAKAAGAGEYAISELESAEEALSSGKGLMDAWRYKKAKEKFEEAYRLALDAKNKALAAQSMPCPEPTGVVPSPVGPPRSGVSHTVVKGECLWWIAEYDQVYGDPFQWPLIYWENQDEIDSMAHRYGNNTHEEDWIYPGQEFGIPQNNSIEDVKKARKRAGAPAPYTPPGN